MQNLCNQPDMWEANVWSSLQDKIGPLYLRTTSGNQTECDIPRSLEHIWSELPGIDDMPSYSTKTVAGVASLKAVREGVVESPKIRDPKNYSISRPLLLLK